MKKIITLMLVAMLALTATFGLTACGNSKTVTIGYTDYPPMNYTDASGKLVGFDTELAEKVFGDLGYKYKFLEIKWDQKYVLLNNGTIDCIWNGFTSNASDDGVPRNQSVDFSYDYMQNAQCILTKTGANLTAWTDLAGKSVAVEADSAADSLVSGAIEDFASDVRLVDKTAQMDAITDLVTGMVDYAVVDVLLADSILSQPDYSSLSKVTGLTIDIEYYAIGFKKGSDLTAKVNEKILAYQQDGSLKTLAEKYNLGTALLPNIGA